MEILHWKKLLPTPNPVTVEVGVVEFVNTPLLDITDQVPVPISGVFPVMVAEVAHIVCVDPAFETVGRSSLVIDTVEVDAGQTPLEILHWKTLTPTLNPLTAQMFDSGVANDPLPEICVQLPTPTVGAFPLNVAVSEQTTELVPATAVVGTWSRMMATVDVEGGHVPLDMVHWKTFVPVEIPVTLEFGDVGDVIIPVPETKVQTPVPTTGVFPLRVAVVAHIV